ncbi:MAG TPA: GntR family transcriptional regulator [Streptosporangiaceae bacterium]|nr:GntR family transcriptional regulator [Streptosporangiaceae bacterium]
MTPSGSSGEGSPLQDEPAARGSSSLGDRVYRTLREEIVFLELPPGTPVREVDVAKRLGVGRTPVREALQRLAMNYLVEILPGRGAFVSPISVPDLVKISEIRLRLEGFAAASAAERATADEREVLRGLRDEIRRLTPDTPRRRLIGLDQAVHRAIYNATHNPYLEDCLHRYLNLTLRAWVLVLDVVADVPEMVDEHASLLDAVIEGDAEKAGTLASQHITDFANDFRTALGNPAVRLPVDRQRGPGI